MGEPEGTTPVAATEAGTETTTEVMNEFLPEAIPEAVPVVQPFGYGGFPDYEFDYFGYPIVLPRYGHPNYFPGHGKQKRSAEPNPWYGYPGYRNYGYYGGYYMYGYPGYYGRYGKK